MTLKKFDHLLGLPGMSDALLTNHFTLYEGYVKNTNTLIELLSTKNLVTILTTKTQCMHLLLSMMKSTCFVR
jgi:hypothetical protein